MKYFEKTFHTFVISAAVGLTLGFSGAAHAEGSVNGQVTDHYKWVVNQTPYRVEVCKDYSVGGDKSGDMLKGAIIGGIIGNNVGDVKNGGALGAVLGGMIGHNNSNATGGTQRRCNIETRYEESREEVYSHSTINFYSNGRSYSLRYTK